MNQYVFEGKVLGWEVDEAKMLINVEFESFLVILFKGTALKEDCFHSILFDSVQWDVLWTQISRCVWLARWVAHFKSFNLE